MFLTDLITELYIMSLASSNTLKKSPGVGDFHISNTSQPCASIFTLGNSFPLSSAREPDSQNEPRCGDRVMSQCGRILGSGRRLSAWIPWVALRLTTTSLAGVPALLLSEKQGERQTDVTESDHSNSEFAGLGFAHE